MSRLRTRLYIIIFKANTRPGKWFDIILLIAILLSVLLTIIDSIPSIHSEYSTTLFVLEWIFTGIFAIEYFLRIYTSPLPLKYIKSAYGIIDLVAILPSIFMFFVTDSQYILIIRLIRMVRVFKILNLKRFMDNSQMLLRSLISSLYKITIFLLIVFIMVIFIGTLMFLIEGPENGFNSIPKSIYWAIVTITTVGFGDITPQTAIGQMLASVVMLIGYAIIAVPTGIVTVELSKGKKGNLKTNEPINCTNCKNTVYDNDNYCKHCGHQLKKELSS